MGVFYSMILEEDLFENLEIDLWILKFSIDLLDSIFLLSTDFLSAKFIFKHGRTHKRDFLVLKTFYKIKLGEDHVNQNWGVLVETRSLCFSMLSNHPNFFT